MILLFTKLAIARIKKARYNSGVIVNPRINMLRAARIIGRPVSSLRRITTRVIRPVLKLYELFPNCYSVEFTNCELRGRNFKFSKNDYNFSISNCFTNSWSISDNLVFISLS